MDRESYILDLYKDILTFAPLKRDGLKMSPSFFIYKGMLTKYILIGKDYNRTNQLHFTTRQQPNTKRGETVHLMDDGQILRY